HELEREFVSRPSPAPDLPQLVAAPCPRSSPVRMHFDGSGRRWQRIVTRRDEAAAARPGAAEALAQRGRDLARRLQMRESVVADDDDVDARGPDRQRAEVGDDTAERKVTRGRLAPGPDDGGVREIGACHPEPQGEKPERLRADADGGV